MKLLKYAKTFQGFKDDPFGFIIDTLTAIIVNLVVPIPLAGQTILQFRTPVLGCLASLVILGLFMIVVIGTVVMSPFLLSTTAVQQLLSSITNNTLEVTDEGFIQSSIPLQNPLGGLEMSYTTITASFLDPNYLIQFGKNHAGIDLVPNSAYLQSSKTYQETKKVIVYATHTGKARYYVDQYGGETVELTNNEDTLRTIYIHFKEVYVNTGDIIKAGTALGEMGMTGEATGEHVHYEVKIKDGNSWLVVNPLTYIK